MSGPAPVADPSATGTPAVELTGVQREYRTSGESVHALRGVDLRIDEGEYVAVVGPSGSGKSTLMHLVGALDRPTTGTVRIAGQDISRMSDTDLAALRNRRIGFVFQQFHLLARTSALDNVALPLVYRGVAARERRRAAREALEAVGLGHRLRHRPSQLSGGEQQRVAIARALVGDPALLLADEPTGNLDSRNGAEVMALLERLVTERGVAVVLVTHDGEVADRAHRQIRVRDGLVAHDSGPGGRSARTPPPDVRGGRASLAEGLRSAVTSLSANRLRSLLTMLGVIIGVSAVVALVALGSGAQREVTQQVQGLGSNLVLVVPGNIDTAGTGEDSGASISQLTLDDEAALARVVGDPTRVATQTSSTERISASTASTFAAVQGVDADYVTVFDRPLETGEFFTDTDVDTLRRVVVLGSGVAGDLFGGIDPVGRQVSVAGVRFQVVGVFAEQGTAFGISQDDQVYIPVTSAQRLLGVQTVEGFVVKAEGIDDIEQLQTDIVAELQARYPGSAFSAVTQTQILGVIGRILSLLTSILAAIAGISLVVGGVGVSNIMLVSVRERTREIGLRKALGARRRDITVQFLIEAVLLTTVGGLAGLALGIGGSWLADVFSPVPAVVPWWAPVLSFGVSALTGIVFGVAPARRAGRLDPVVALRAD